MNVTFCNGPCLETSHCDKTNFPHEHTAKPLSSVAVYPRFYIELATIIACRHIVMHERPSQVCFIFSSILGILRQKPFLVRGVLDESQCNITTQMSEKQC